MHYRKLLELYKAGQLDEDTRRQVEADIQRQDAISDYLFDEQELSVCENTPQSEDGKSSQMLNLIQKSIQRAFVKMGIAVAAAVLAVVALCVFVLPWFVSIFYYNPNDVVGRYSENEHLVTTRMDLDLSVFSEMFLPGAIRDQVNAQSEGWGNYRISIPQLSSFDGHFHTLEGYLSRGELTLYNTDILRPPAANAFVLPQNVKTSFALSDSATGQRIGAAGSPEQAMENLNNLAQDRWYTGYISLSEITDYSEFYTWYDGLSIKSAGTWCAVYTEDEDGYMLGNNMGFSISSVDQSQYWDTDRYPYLCRMGDTQSFSPDDLQQSKAHFTSMLRYLRDYPQIGQMISGGLSIEKSLMDEMISSIDRDGLRVYGFAVQAKKETLQKLAADPRVSYIYTTPVS